MFFELFHGGLMSAPVIQKSDSNELLENFCDVTLASIYFQAYDYMWCVARFGTICTI